MFHMISAGAGCGKTTFIIEKIKNIISQNPKTTILVITYTNSCVDEIKQRLNTSNKVEICTFHALCNKFSTSNKIFTESNQLEVLSSFINLDISPEFKNFYNYLLTHTPFDYNEYIKTLKEVFPGELYKEKFNQNLEDFFCQNGHLRKKIPPFIKNPTEWMGNFHIIKNHLNALNYKYNLDYLEFFNQIEKTRKTINVYTFHHMILEILDNIDEFTMHIWEKYDHIFIDEVQDLSHIQFQIIINLTEELVFLPDKSITIVGDVNQSIFSFQGANKTNFDNFITKIKNIPSIKFQETQLNNTYRFGGEILDFVNKAFYPHTSDNKEGKIHLYNLTDPSHLLQTIITTINQIPSTESILILFQKRSTFVNQLEEFVEKNTNRKIQIHKKIFQDHDLLKDFFYLIEFIITKQEIYLIYWLLGSMIHIPEPDFFIFCQKYKDNIYINLLREYNSLQEIHELQQLYDTKNIYEFLNIFQKTILYQNFCSIYGKEVLIFMQELEKIKDPSLSLYHLLYLKNRDLWFPQIGNIIFSTIHNAKGTEADHVLIIDGNNGEMNSSLFLKKNFPIYNFYHTNTKHINSEEYNNLMYVAVTRSRKSLHIFGTGIKIHHNSLYYIISNTKTSSYKII